LIEKGKYFLEQAAAGDKITDYHIEAAIAGCHARASSFEKTNWGDIDDLYTILSDMKNSPVISLNRAIAIRYHVSPEAGLKALLAIEGLQQHYLYHAALGDVYVDVGDLAAARVSYERALCLTSSIAEKKLLQFKMDRLA